MPFLAGVTAYVYGDVGEARHRTVRIVGRTRAIPGKVQLYSKYHPIYDSLYDVSSPTLDALAELTRNFY